MATTTPNGVRAHAKHGGGSSTDAPMTHRQIMEALSGLLLGMFCAILSSTIVTNALPEIVSDLGGGQTAFTSAVKHGASHSDVAATMLNSQEFRQQHGSLASSAFVDLLYQGALGRSADSSGLQFWQGLLDTGVSRASVAVGIAQSPDAQQHQIHTAWALL